MKAFGEWSKFLEQVKMTKKERHGQSRGMSFTVRTEEICAHFSSLESPCFSSRASPSSSSSRKHLLLSLQQLHFSCMAVWMSEERAEG